jgi:hypothetical protein
MFISARDGGCVCCGLPLCVAAACLLLLSLLIGAAACGRTGDRVTNVARVDNFPLAERIGWFHGPCLASANPSLSPGTPVLLVLTTEPQTTAAGEIGPRTSSAETCKPLLEDRATENAKAGVVFYAVTAKGIEPTEMGIGIVDPPPATPRIVNGRVRIDLDGNGRPVAFSSCATTEGIRFAAWTEEAYRGEPRWTAYYYLGYSSQPNCPK